MVRGDADGAGGPGDEAVAGREGARRSEVVRCASDRPGRRTSRVAFTGDAPGDGDPLLDFAPYVHARPRRNSITPDRQRAFIATLAATGIVTQAARSIGASLEALYKIRHQPGAEGFSAAWDAAVDRGMERLEDCALERAIAGEERVVLHRGEVVARSVRYDTPLLMFLLRNRRRDRYGWAPGRAEIARMVAEEEAARRPDPAQVLATLNAKLELMRQRVLAAKDEAREEWAEDGEDEADVAATEPDADGADARQPGDVRLIHNLPREGDKALGLPRAYKHGRIASMIGIANMAPRIFPLTHEEATIMSWEREMDAGIVGPRARARAESERGS